MTTQRGWWKRLFSDGEAPLHAQLAALGARLVDQEALVEQLQSKLEHSEHDVELQRQARENANQAAATAREALNRSLAEAGVHRDSVERHRIRALRAESALKRAEDERTTTQSTQRGELQRRMETAENDATTLRALNTRLVEELAELRTELEHAHAESIRAGSLTSARPNGSPSARSPTVTAPPSSAQQERCALLQEALRGCITAAARALDAALGSRSPLAAAMGFEDTSGLLSQLGAATSFDEAARKVEAHLTQLGLLDAIDLRPDSDGLGIAFALDPAFDEGDGVAVARWLSVYIISCFNATHAQAYRLRHLDGGPARYAALALPPAGMAMTYARDVRDSGETAVPPPQ